MLFELESESAWIDSKGKYIRYGMKSMVQRKVADIRTLYERNKSNEYFRYLNENAERINNLIDTVLRDSEQNIVELSLTQLYTIFARTYTLSDLKNIENEYGE